MSEARRDKLGAQMVLAAAALLALAVLLFRFFVYESPSRPAASSPPAAPAAPILKHAVVLQVEGRVEHGTADGSWSSLSPGQKLRADDRLRTFQHGRTQLGIDGRSRVTIDEDSEVAIAELTEKVHRFRLTRGRMDAEYESDGKRVLRVEDDGGATVAEAAEARFSVLSNGTALAVATSSGDVDLTAQNKTVRLAAGESSVALVGNGPSQPARIPTSVVLKVANTVAGASAALCAEVEGRADPGAQVLVDGEPAPVTPEGAFRVSVKRKAGKRAVRIAMRDAAGRTRVRNVPCSPAPAPIDDMAIRWRQP
jgi:hypothetical protein